jgi:hypothetical protein
MSKGLNSYNALLIILGSFVLGILVLIAISPGEPDEKNIKAEFIKLYPNCALLSYKNTEISPPCFYWEIKYKCRNQNDIIIESWQFWETDKKGKWNLGGIYRMDRTTNKFEEIRRYDLYKNKI